MLTVHSKHIRITRKAFFHFIFCWGLPYPPLFNHMKLLAFPRAAVQSHPWSLRTFCPPFLEHSLMSDCCPAPTSPFVLNLDRMSAWKPPPLGHVRLSSVLSELLLFPLLRPPGCLEGISGPAVPWTPWKQEASRSRSPLQPQHPLDFLACSRCSIIPE